MRSELIICPYCEKQIDSTDFYEDDENVQCDGCGKHFSLEIEYSPIFWTSKSCSLNNEKHTFIPSTTSPMFEVCTKCQKRRKK